MGSFLAGPAPAMADAEPFTAPHAFDAVFLLRAGYWSSSRTLDDRTGLTPAQARARVGYRPSDAWRASFDGWIGNHDFAGAKGNAAIRELYLEWLSERVDVRIGKQIISWGRADRLNPTDNLGAKRYTLLTAEDDEQRIGTNALKQSWHLGQFSLTGIWEPRFTPSEIPFKVQSGVSIEDARPARDSAWAVKLTREREGTDWSISYYSGPDRMPDITPVAISAGRISLANQYHRLGVIGADWATTLAPYGFRGEAAFARTEDAAGDKPFVKNPYVYVVVGADRQFADGLSVNSQVFYKRVFRYQSPDGLASPTLRQVAVRSMTTMDQLDEKRYGVSLWVSKRWLNDTWEAEVSLVKSYPRGDYVVRPRLIHRVSDQWKVLLGADVLRGADPSYFGQLRNNTAVYVNVELSR